MAHCEKCNDMGFIVYEKDGYKYAKECSCVKAQKSLINAENSGLGELLTLYTFDRFKTDFAFQKDLYNKAREYLNENSKWFTVLGKTGTGKTMICVAICGELLKRGKEVRFMSWTDESRNLKSIANEKSYNSVIEPYKNAGVLYIDDFFKAENNTAPSSADIKLAYEIIGYRYNKALATGKGYQTIISTERTLEQLVSYDEAIIGRIVELSGKYVKVISPDAINYRLKNFKKEM